MKDIYEIKLKKRYGKMFLQITPQQLDAVLNNDKEVIKSFRSVLDTIKEKGSAPTHDIDTLTTILQNVSNKDGKATPQSEMFAIMKLLLTLVESPKDKELTLKLPKYLVDIITGRIKNIQLNVLSPEYAAFVMDWLEATETKLYDEEIKGENLDFEIEITG